MIRLDKPKKMYIANETQCSIRVVVAQRYDRHGFSVTDVNEKHIDVSLKDEKLCHTEEEAHTYLLMKLSKKLHKYTKKYQETAALLDDLHKRFQEIK